MTTSGRAMAAVAAVVAVMLPAAALAGTSPGPTPAPDQPENGATMLVSVGEGGPTYYDPTALAPSLSGDGSTVAYMSSESPVRVRVRDVLTRATTDLPHRMGNSTVDWLTPSLSADATRVAATAEVRGSGVRDSDHYVVDLTGDEPAPHRVTDDSGDLRFQRTVRCWPGTYYESPEDADRCGPQLSADGRTVVFEARLSAESPQLGLALDLGEAWVPLDDLGLVDFGDGRTQSRRVLVDNEKQRPVQVDDVRVVGGGGAFSIVADEKDGCSGVRLQPDRGTTRSAATTATRRAAPRDTDQCSIQVLLDRDPSRCGTSYGRVVLNGPTPSGRSMFLVVGDNGPCPPTEPPRRPDCGEPPPPEVSYPWPDDVGSSRVDLQACKLEYSIVSPK